MKRLYNEELHRLYGSSNIVKVDNCGRLRWAGHVVRIEYGKDAFKILTGTPTGKKNLEKPRRKWKDNIRKDFKEIVIITRNWVDLTQNRGSWRALVNAVLNLPILFNRCNFPNL